MPCQWLLGPKGAGTVSSRVGFDDHTTATRILAGELQVATEVTLHPHTHIIADVILGRSQSPTLLYAFTCVQLQASCGPGTS